MKITTNYTTSVFNTVETFYGSYADYWKNIYFFFLEVVIF